MGKGTPYSYHTFIFPFIWKCKGDSYKKLIKCFEDNENWVDTNMKDKQDIASFASATDAASRKTKYKEFQYFHPFVRKAIYGFDDKERIVRNFSFNPESIRKQGARYRIEKIIEEKDEESKIKKIENKIYVLDINAINLKIYNTGVALFIMECENYQYPSLAEVKNINEYGRRINLPFIPVLENESIIADSLTVELGDKVFTSDFRKFIQDINSKAQIDKNDVSMTHVADFIKEILGYGSTYSFSSRKIYQDDVFYIYPALDDRMFVACIFNGKDDYYKVIGKTEGITSEEDYLFYKNNDCSKSLYEYIYVDKAGGCTCQNSAMRNRLIKDSAYLRWIDYGSAYFVTNYSFMFLGDGAPDHLIESFLTQYVQMFCLGIVQRASLIKFQREASNLSIGLEKSTKKLKRSTILKIVGLEERFVAFTGQLCFDEVSPEQQGIELFDMIKAAFFIDKEKATMKDQMATLYETANTSLDIGINKIMLIFTWLSLTVAVASMAIASLQTSLDRGNENKIFSFISVNAQELSLVCMGISVIVGILVILSYQFCYRKRK
ncbi:MAG: hypothetical protein PUC12_00240, partial [Clostridiales bacterium]|nr:hypothetical protein [Clostridiales bacterium]